MKTGRGLLITMSKMSDVEGVHCDELPSHKLCGTVKFWGPDA